MLINKDRENDHEMNITFRDAEQRHALHLNEPVERITFSAAKYQWREGENGNLAEPEGPLQKPRCRAGRTLCMRYRGERLSSCVGNFGVAGVEINCRTVGGGGPG